MRFLFLNRFFGGDQTPTGRMLEDAALELVHRGHSIHVVASRASYAGSPMPAQSREGVSVRFRREIGLGRLARWGSYWLQSMVELRKPSWDTCVLLTDPPFLPYAVHLTRRARLPQQRVFWWTMDLYPEALLSSGRLRDGVLFRTLRKTNELGLTHMAGIISLGPSQRHRLQSYQHCENGPESITVVPPWDLRPIRRVNPEENAVLTRFGWRGKKLALYAGNLGEGHLFKPFLDAARLLDQADRSDWVIAFVVRGAARPGLQTAAQGLRCVRILDYLPSDETADLLWSASVHLVSMKPGWEGVIVPSKLYAALQTCAPVLFLGPPAADTALELKRLERGLQIPTNATGQDVLSALEELASPGWVKPPLLDTTGPQRVADFLLK